VSLATAEAIRDQILTLIEGITPTSLSGDKFRRYRNEGGADFEEWANRQPTAAFRRVQARQVGEDEPPTVSNTTTEEVKLTIQILVAYSQNARAGSTNALDRDDAINKDWKSINAKVGIYGRGNFSSTNDCTPRGATMTMERGNGIDMMTILAVFTYQRSIS
jgi:hypothetical protein